MKNAAGLVGVFCCEFVRENVAAKLPAEAIIRGKLREHTRNDLATLRRAKVRVFERQFLQQQRASGDLVGVGRN